MNGVDAVTEYLNLNVARAGNEVLEIKSSVTECGGGLRTCEGHEAAQIILGLGDTDTAPTAAGRRFDHDRIADIGSDRRCFIGARDPPGATRNTGCTRGGGDRAGRRLVAHLAYCLRTRTDKSQAGLLDGGGKVGALGEEAITWMHGVGAGSLGGRHYRFRPKIGFGGLSRPDLDSFIGEADGEHVPVGLAHDLHGPDAELAGRPDDADSDLATVGDQEFLDRHSLLRKSIRPRSPIRPRSHKAADPP